jgi:hypothetical protein
MILCVEIPAIEENRSRKHKKEVRNWKPAISMILFINGIMRVTYENPISV